MNYALFPIAVFASLALCSYQTKDVGLGGPLRTELVMDVASLSFHHPKTGHLFSLHLRDELHQETGGITAVPKGVIGSRDATSSYYEPKDANGSGYASAESLYSRDIADIAARNTTIQYQSDSGRLLITEDKSDGLPCRRYILYTDSPNGGYDVRYLAPPYAPVFSAPGLPSIPPDIKLLSGDRAELGGKIIRIKDIPQSIHPFSLGG